MLSIQDFLVLVRSLEGSPYAHAGRSREGGLDCIGVVVIPLLELGLPIHDVRNYSREAFSTTLAQAIGRHGTAIDPAERQPGDILLFWCNRRTRLPQHVAVMTAPLPNEEMVHAYLPIGRVVRSPIGGWSRRITNVFRVPTTMLSRS